MSTFTPTSIRFDPPGPPDYLGGAVLRAFARPQPAFVSWGLFRTLIVGVLTCGIAPLFFLSKRLRWYVAGQNANLEYARQWIERDANASAAVPQIPRDAGGPPIASLVYFAAVMIAIVAIGAIVLSLPQIAPSDIYSFAFAGVDSDIYRGWLIALCVAYALHFAAVHRCVRLLRIRVDRINAAIKDRGIEPIARPRLRGGGRFFGWLLVGIIPFVLGGFWAVPMMLAACAQRRYIRHTSKLTREDVSRVLREIAVRRPAGAPRLVVPESFRARCPHPDCVGRIRPEAQFCPNCGRRVSGNIAMTV